MASVTLSSGLMAPATDLSDTFVVNIDGLIDNLTRDGEVRNYVGGRQRAVVRPGRTRTLQLQASDMPRSTFEDRLVAQVGVLHLFRDPLGRALYGVWLDPFAVETIGDRDLVDVQFTFRVTTDTAAV